MANSSKNKQNKKTTSKTSIKQTKKKNAEKPVGSKFGRFMVAVAFILCPLIVGLISSAITGDAMMNFAQLKQPPLAPPAWLFPVAWSVLYLLMGVASYLIFVSKPRLRRDKNLRKSELVIYFLQLAFNFMWTIFFFKLELRFFSFGWLIVMWLMIFALIVMAFHNKKSAAWCLIPYIIWCTFAAYLNIMIAVLN